MFMICGRPSAGRFNRFADSGGSPMAVAGKMMFTRMEAEHALPFEYSDADLEI